MKKDTKNKRCCAQPFVVVGCIIEKDGKILMIREGGKWNQPSGWLELKENIINGARREAEEETGLKIEIVSLLGVYTLIKKKQGQILHAVKFIFLAKPRGKSKTYYKNRFESRWFNLEDIKKVEDQLWDLDILKEIEDYRRGKTYSLEAVSRITYL
ncbi:NUDIX domain-containing protein [Patescibacteria group bacterium]|nr:NUDIX domain-containing protein [Patescibacteria group bacterium]